MGIKAAEALDINFDDFKTFLRAKGSVYMELDGVTYYLTDANEIYWRVQSTTQFNEKGHYTDISELVPTLSEFLDLPFGEDNITIASTFDRAVFYASETAE